MMTQLKFFLFLFVISFFFACTGTSSNSGNTNNSPTSNPVKPITPTSQPTSGTEVSNPESTPPEVNKVFIRQNIFTWASNGPEMQAYKKGVAAMKARSADDPTSWSYQAAIHGSIKEPVKEAWNQCQHQSFFFLSWHRMYLYYFEKILREASGDPNFALPYWNYSNEDERMIPEVFRSPADDSNPLYVSDRNPGVNEGFEVPASATEYEAAFDYNNFYSPEGSPLSFGGQEVGEFTHFGSTNGKIEQEPHNVIHVVIGGWMNDPNFAAQDPIFWLHHANIDRLWNKWLNENPNHKNPIDNDTWMNQEFEFFNENGELVKMSGKDVIDSATQLFYKYDDEEETMLASIDDNKNVLAQGLPTNPKDTIPMKKKIVLDETVNLKVDSESTSLPVKLNSKTKRAFSNMGPGAAKEVRMVLNLEKITYEKIPTGFYEVYLNLPDNIKNPDYKSDYYVGNIGFFGKTGEGSHGHHSDGININFEITKLIGKQMRAGIWDHNNLNLSFFLRGMVAPDGTSKSLLEKVKPNGNIRIGKVTLESYER